MLKRLSLAGLLIATVLVPGTSSASHGRGALYVGRVEGGGKIELRVSDSGRNLDIDVTNVPGDECSFRHITRTDVSIRDHSFSAGGVTGSFTERGEASGKLRVKSQGCDSGSHEWTATKRVTRTLNLVAAGDGGGRIVEVSEDFDPLICRDECSKDYVEGAEVVLRARPNPTSQFVGWSGACSGTGRCTVRMNSNKTVTATFIAVRELTVLVDGTGAGTVTSSPTGISCPNACEHEFEAGEAVQLTATPEEGSVFTGWTGACEGTEPCSLTMDTNQDVIASFDTSGNGPGDPDYQGFWTGTTSQEREVGLTVLRDESYNIAELTISWEKPNCSVAFKDSSLTPALEIEPDGSFSHNITSDGNIRFTLAGTFTSATEVSGTLEVEAGRSCGDVSVTWSATRT